MQPSPLAALLVNLEVFAGLTDRQLTALLREVERVSFRDGDTIIRDGDVGHAAYIIISGRAEVLPDAERHDTAKPVEPGTLLGEMAMLIEHEYRTTVVARSPVRAAKIPRSSLHRMMLDDTKLTEHFVEKISTRLSRVKQMLQIIDETLLSASELDRITDALEPEMRDPGLA
jgi:CRP/FNR family cyclic AMP-dependent transcriptional regulator